MTVVWVAPSENPSSDTATSTSAAATSNSQPSTALNNTAPPHSPTSSAQRPTSSGGPPQNPTPNTPPIPGFSEFAVSRFSPLAWSIPATPGFDAKDAQGRLALAEVAALQLELRRRCGAAYTDRLRGELAGMGVDAARVAEYVAVLEGGSEKAFRQFFVGFVGRGGGG